MGKTKISWTEMTWNPVRGCSRVSEGCRHCYAERMAARFSVPPAHEREVQRPAPFAGFARMTANGGQWTGKVELIESALDIPLRRKKPTTWFVNSMSDLFHESLPDEDVYRVFAIMERCPQHKFQVLTKRAARLPVLVKRIYGSANMGRVLPNVWLGVSCEDQKTADERIPLLIQTPAALRFVSLEPLLGPITLRFPAGSRAPDPPDGFESWTEKRRADWFAMQARATYMTRCEMLDWVIVGGESGPGARPCDVSWIRSVVKQCLTAEVACFVKQLGSVPVIAACRQHHWDFGESIGKKAKFSAMDSQHPSTGLWRVHLEDHKGGDPSEWAEDLRVRQIPKEATSGVPEETVRG